MSSMSLTQYLPQERAAERMSCKDMSPEKLENGTPAVVELVSLYAAWYALEVFEYQCKMNGVPGECTDCMTAVGKLAKEKVSHLFFSKGVHFDHIDALRNAAREMAAAAIKKSGQF